MTIAAEPTRIAAGPAGTEPHPWGIYGLGQAPFSLLARIDASYPPDLDGKPNPEAARSAETFRVALGECQVCEQPIEVHYVAISSDERTSAVCRACIDELGSTALAKKAAWIDHERERMTAQLTGTRWTDRGLDLPAEASGKTRAEVHAEQTAKAKAPDTCRLVLSVRGTDYGVRPLANQAHEDRRAWSLRKPDGTTYHVAETAHGATCDCGDWQFRREHLDAKGCKHVRALVALGLVSNPTGQGAGK